MRLDFLEELALRTASPLTYSPTIVSEKATLLKWTIRTARSPVSAKQAMKHPTLSCLRVWYRCREPGGGVSTCWSKSSGSWQNVFRLAKPPADTLF